MKELNLRVVAPIMVLCLACLSISVPYVLAEEQPLHLGLTDCLRIALENNQYRQISQLAIEIAEAQHQQALSSYWPQFKLGVLATIRDEEFNFIFPEEVSTYTISDLAPVPMETRVTVPEKDVKLTEREVLLGGLEFTYPLYAGGKRAAQRTLSRLGVQHAKTAARRTDLQVVYDIKRLYYGTLLARRLRRIGDETFERFEVLLQLTERLYTEGAGSVKKTDYLRTQVVVSAVRSMLALLESNEHLAKTALIYSIGLNWRAPVTFAEEEFPFQPYQAELTTLVASAYRFNPDWEALELGLQADEATIRNAESGHFPTIALTGNLTSLASDYEKGITTEQNQHSWNIGIGLELPLFKGFRTKYAIKEAQLKLERRKHEQILLREGLALQIQQAFLQLTRAEEQVDATNASLRAATENRELNVRAYQYELAEVKDVIEAQLLESFMKAQHLKARHDHAVQRAQLERILGNEIQKIIR